VLTRGQAVPLRRTRWTWQVGATLGEGSQGTVYELAAQEAPEQRLALKWYQPAAATPAQREAIATLVRWGAPSDRFLWPLDLVDVPGRSGFGYVMPLRPQGFVGLAEILRGRVDAPPSLAVRICLELASAFLSLHAQGLCYRDISFGNIMVDPTSGVISVCDNDNVGVDGGGHSAVLGTRRFMAPEIVRGEARPNAATDLHSLAVLTFYVLMMAHPLLGRRELDYPCVDREAEAELFGRAPLFIFDPQDDANAPDPIEHAGALANWRMHPQAVRRLFEQAFGAGLAQPDKRVRESVWRATLARLLDAIATCPTCGKESFVGDGAPEACWSCQTPLGEPIRLAFPSAEVILGARTRITRHHLHRDYNVTDVVGAVARHPSKPLWGLQNLSADTWTVRRADREPTSVGPQQSLTLVADSEIDFGPVSATIRR